tara:strand:- start:2225 stop:2431 length:207 start_codon:yes stop_codon:yes gene_type:complete
MGRTISGSKYLIPSDMPPLAWANEVWNTMDELGVTESEAKTIVAARYEKSEEQPAVDKMVKQSRNKGV